jgi:hypothetical protein
MLQDFFQSNINISDINYLGGTCQNAKRGISLVPKHYYMNAYTGSGGKADCMFSLYLQGKADLNLLLL